MKKKYKINLELYDNYTVETGIEYVRGDKNCYPLAIQLEHKDTIVSLPTNSICQLIFTVNDEIIDTRSINDINYEAGLLNITLSEEAVSKVGKVMCELKITNTDDLLTFPKFAYKVNKTLSDYPEVTPEKYRNWVQDINETVSEIKGIVDNVVTESEIDQKDEQVLESANEYTDEKVSESSTNLVNYTDTKISAVNNEIVVINQDLADRYTKNETDNLINEEATAREVADDTLDAQIQVLVNKISGVTTGYVFDTVDDMNQSLQDEEFVAKLKVGDNLYIKDLEVADFWWDGTQALELETPKADLSNYYVKNEVDTIATNTLDSAKVYADGKIAKSDIVDVTGSSTDKVMNQKVVTDELNKISSKVLIDTGTTNNIVVDDEKVPLRDGLIINFSVTVQSISTIIYLNYNGTGNKRIYNWGTTALTSGQLMANGVYSVVYKESSNSYLLTNPTRDASTNARGVTQLNDTLTSTSTSQSLTANQGRVLNEKVEINTSDITEIKDTMYNPPVYATKEEAYNALAGHKGLVVGWYE